MCDHQPGPLEQLLASNKKWAQDMETEHPGFFKKLAEGQAPKVLWIGCADSRVPESVITAALPGAIFVHRNIANQFHLNDDNALSVVTFAVEKLHVEHIIVVGHTDCGGAIACYKAAKELAYNPDKAAKEPIVTLPTMPATAPMNVWLAPLTRLGVYLITHPLHPHYTPADPVLQLTEANVRAQVANVASTESGRKVPVHGWLFDLKTGTLVDLKVTIQPTEEPEHHHH